MSVPPEMMRALMAGGQQPQPPQPGGVNQGPPGAPVTQPQVPAGNRMAAISRVGIAMKLLEQVIPEIGVDTDEGQAVMKALAGLSKIAGKSSDQALAPAELAMLNRAVMGGQQSGPPGMQEMMMKQGTPQGMPQLPAQGA